MIHQNAPTHAAWEDQPAHLVSWKSVAAGFLVALFSMTALMGLGMAFGGISIDEEVTARGASIFTGLWFLVSAILSIFLGSYYSARLSAYRVPKLGAANGLLIACLFVFFFIMQAFSAIGTIGKTAGTLVESTASGVGELAASNPGSTAMIANFVEEQFMGLELRSSPQVVASGVASRLLNGNTEGAKNYLAYQANIQSAEAQSRITQLRTQANRMIEDAKETTASALKATGWSLFFLIILSSLASVSGGFLGSRTNIAHPITENVGLFKVRHT